jgi:hypothetical protein
MEMPSLDRRLAFPVTSGWKRIGKPEREEEGERRARKSESSCPDIFEVNTQTCPRQAMREFILDRLSDYGDPLGDEIVRDLAEKDVASSRAAKDILKRRAERRRERDR